jgi:penicillin amidase
VVLEVLEKPDPRLGSDPVAARNELLLSTLRQAVDDLEKRLGPNMESWAWGGLHHAFFEHPLSSIVDEATRARLNVGPKPRGGSEDTVCMTWYRPSDFRQIIGATWRMILDVGNWDNSLVMNSPGQSGDPFSPHYADLFPRWATDQAFPLLYSREFIEAVAEQRILLQPASR